MQAEEERLTVSSQRLQAKVDAFRTRKEAIKAAHVAAQAAAEATWAEAVIDDADADAEGAGSAADDAVNAGAPDPARPSLPLSELRPGAPESADTRILFTIELPGTAVLLAAGMEDDWAACLVHRSHRELPHPLPARAGEHTLTSRGRRTKSGQLATGVDDAPG